MHGLLNRVIFFVDESGIGGNDVVSKHFGIIAEDNTRADELYNTVFCGTYVIKGNAKVVVTDVGKRVYAAKSYKNNSKKLKLVSGLHDFSKMLSLVLCAITVLFTLISFIVAKAFIALPVTVLIWISLFASDFLLKFIKISFVNTFYRLRNKGIYLGKASSVDSINNADVILVGKDHIFEDNYSITGIVTDKSEFFKTSEVNKSNFAVILYSAFCDDKLSDIDSASPYLKSAVKLMRSIRVDYNDIESVCPVVSHYISDDAIEMCGRVYDGNNMLIARGNYKSILKLCDITDDFDYSTLEPLITLSSEVIAVAVKNVSIIPEDLSEENSGFRIVGFIGIFNSVSKSAYEIYKSLDTHSIILYPGNISSAKLAFGDDNLNSVSVHELAAVSSADIMRCDVICDYDGDITTVSDVLTKKRIKCAFSGNKEYDSKHVSIKTYDSTPYDNVNADVVLKSKKDNIASIVNSCSYCFKAINKVTENLVSLTAIYSVCTLLFAILFKGVIFNPVSVAFIVFLALPIISFSCLKLKSSHSLNKYKVSSSVPIRRNNMFSTAISLLIFIVLVIILKFCAVTELAVGIILLAFAGYMPSAYAVDSFKKEKIKWLVLAFVPFIILSVLFLTPCSVIFGISGFRFWMVPVCLAIGIAIRLISDHLSVSVKN